MECLRRAFLKIILVVGAVSPVDVVRAQSVGHEVPYTAIGRVALGHQIVRQGDVGMCINFDTEQREIAVEWCWGPDGYLWNAVCRAPQSWTVAYWPTDVVRLADGAWLVSGKDPVTFETIIERWDFANEGWARVTPRPDVDPLTGSPECSWALPERTSAAELYREASPGRDVVDWCVEHPCKPHSVLVRFQDSKDLYELDLAPLRYTLIASPTLASAPLRAGRAGPSIEHASWVRHATRGLLLVITPRGDLCGNIRWFMSRTVLADADEDGTFDRTYELSLEQWLNSDWADERLYLEYFH